MKLAVFFMISSTMICVAVAVFLFTRLDDNMSSIFLPLTAIAFAIGLLLLSPVFLLALKEKNKRRDDTDSKNSDE